ncbi:MAG: hypothetical protein HYV63_04070 [Candidatus Schekmanbacteria bacterium]|nr:hypothetical protein [Candidatus Schekmanbacteria bacterium]
MRFCFRRPLLASLAVLVCLWGAAAGGSPAPHGAELLAGLPLHFEPSADGGGFWARARGYDMILSPGQADIVPRRGQQSARIRLRFAGAAPGSGLFGGEPLPGRTSYFVGADPARWRPDVPHFARVTARAVYPGIDATYYGSGQAVELDLIAAPGTDVGRAALLVEGAEAVTLGAEGELVLAAGGQTMRLLRPRAYQPEGATRQMVACAYRLAAVETAPGRSWRVSFDLGDPVRPDLPLVIDPVVAYGTFWGGGDADSVRGMALGSGGEIYLSGNTYSADFPLQGALQSDIDSTTAFVSKLSPDGKQLLYSTLLGGSGQDYDTRVAVAADGTILLAGVTDSVDFPVVAAFQPTKNGDELADDLFVAAIAPGGASLRYASYLGGNGVETMAGIAADSNGALVVGGWTDAVDFPTVNALDATLGGINDGFLTRIDAGGAIAYSTFLGGSGGERVYGLAVSSADEVHTCGITYSPDFPVTAGAFQGALDADGSSFVAVLDPDGSRVERATFLGGSQLDQCTAIAVTAAGEIAVAGIT